CRCDFLDGSGDNRMFGSPELSIRVVHVATQSPLSTDKGKVTLVREAIGVAAQAVTSVNRIHAFWLYRFGSDALPTTQGRNSFESTDFPVFRNRAKPLHPTVLVLRIPRQAHSANSPSIRMMLAATSFRSASINSSGRGGSNT